MAYSGLFFGFEVHLQCSQRSMKVGLNAHSQGTGADTGDVKWHEVRMRAHSQV